MYIINKTVFFVVLVAVGVVISVISIVVLFVLFVFLLNDQPKPLLPTCDSYVYCQGDLLHYAQTLATADTDSKYFVDLAMVADEEIILERFNKLMESRVLDSDSQKRMRKILWITSIIVTVIILAVIIFVAIYFSLSPNLLDGEEEENEKIQNTAVQPTCDSMIYCQGPLLHYAQLVAPASRNSKYFVDLVMLHDERVILNNFDSFLSAKDNNPNLNDMKQFLEENFVNRTGLNDWYPTDFTENPAFLEQIGDTKIKEFAKAVVSRWKDLGRKVNDDVRVHPQRYSLIYVPHGFIVPGGRFSEYYYWDSYWIIDGLLISDMPETVRGMIENFLALIDNIGFIPNSGRIYHIRRSQPPLFSSMVRLYYEHTKDKNWLRLNLRTIETEAKFWETSRMMSLYVKGVHYRLAIYNATTSGPRPESYKEDLATASRCQNQDERLRLYIELKSAAESGWDFSSRWIFDRYGDRHGTIAATNVTRVAPVDLNAFLYGVFENIAYFSQELGEESRMLSWRQKAIEIKRSITDLMWNELDHTWYDYDIVLKRQRRFFSASNLTPLWTKAYYTDGNYTATLINKVTAYLERENVMSFLGGIPTTTENSGEQWDFPNNWPCLQHILVEGLQKSGVEKGKKMAEMLAKTWIEAVVKSYDKDGNLYEKYNAEEPGKHGGGGEYKTQIGFGWTNGVVLRFIKEYFSKQNTSLR